MLIKAPADELHLKIAYFGPGMSGKTTNLKKIREIIGPSNTSEITSIDTHYNRTLFFDFIQLKIDSIYGLNLRINLYTVPGQELYKAIQEIVLNGIDGLVFVVDSQRERIGDNLAALIQLKKFLANAGISFLHIPKVFQYNKQDLATALKPEVIKPKIMAENMSGFPASAINGIGVIETLKEIILMITDANSK